jgi:hypothetical protein
MTTAFTRPNRDISAEAEERGPATWNRTGYPTETPESLENKKGPQANEGRGQQNDTQSATISYQQIAISFQG